MSSPSVSMVWLAAQDPEAAVDLLEHQQADEPVRDRELAEREQLFCALAERVAVAVCAADREHDRRAAAVLGLGAEDVVRERDARHRRAPLVERVEMRGLRDRREQRGLVLGLDDRQRAVRPETLEVLGLGRREIRLLEPTDDGERDLQRGASLYGPTAS